MTAVITIHFRKPALTAKCIDSLLADGWGPVLVWDNSGDGGCSLQELAARYVGERRVQLVENAANLGFGKGMNAALAELGRSGHEGPVLLVNNDATVIPGLRLAMLAQAAQFDSPALLAPRIVQDGREHGWRYYQPWFALVTDRPVPGSFAFLSGCALLVIRADNAQPLFDEDFFMYGEDVELSWRMRRQGGRLVLLDRAWLVHEGSASSGQASETYERMLVRAHCLLARKLAADGWRTFAMRASQLPSLLARASLRALRYRSLVPLRVLNQLWRRSSSLPVSQSTRR